MEHHDPADVEKQTCVNFRNEDVDSLAWRNLTVKVAGGDLGESKVILDRVSGVVYPGEMMAVMGPSGSGKTTLLNALAHRQTSGVEGKVFVNGATRSLEMHREISTFAEQEDTLIGSLTVEESLRFTASLALPRTFTKASARARVAELIESLGLTDQRRTLIGTPLRKGLSGGQKRRVSVATQLITGPRIIYLDEPTSGLDSSAGFEVMQYIGNLAKQCDLIVVASIHQPSTKLYGLFSKVLLLSKGRTCYYGTPSELPHFFYSIGLPIPTFMNPAEQVLGLLNVDFTPSLEKQTTLDRIFDGWRNSEQKLALDDSIKLLTHTTGRLALVLTAQRPSMPYQILTLLHRNFTKSYRDVVAYWIRIAMYMGLAIMMGTVWVRLGTTQEHIQPFVNAIFFGSAFMSFMAVAYVPAFLEDRASFAKERANGLYGPTVFLLSNFLIGLPYLFLISVLFSIVAYWLINLEPTGSAFFTWILWLFLDLLAAESLVVLISSIVPNFVVALAVIAFANGLWMSVGGFLVPLPVLDPFWRFVFHYIDYQAYVFQGMMVNEFKNREYTCSPVSETGQCHCMYPSALEPQCKIAGDAVLHAYGYPLGKEGEWIGIMISIIAVYRLLGWVVTKVRKS